MADYTEHYQLHQWQPQDPFLRTDFNEDLQKIDTALSGLADKTTALETAVALCGNCRIESFIYEGTGTSGASNPTVLNFSKPPMVFFVLGSKGTLMMGSKLSNSTVSLATDPIAHSTGNVMCSVTWSGNQASVVCTLDTYYAYDFQMNASNTTYYVFAFFAEDE